MRNLCPRCRQEPAIRHPLYGLLPGKKCVKKDRKKVGRLQPLPEFPTLTMADRINDQRDKYAKDMIQPHKDGINPDPEFVKAYPDQAKEYFTQEQLEKL